MCVAVFPTISLQIHFNNFQIYSLFGEAFESCKINVMTRNQNDVERGVQQMCRIRRNISLHIMEIKLHLLRINLKRFLRNLLRNYFNKYKFYRVFFIL